MIHNRKKNLMINVHSIQTVEECLLQKKKKKTKQSLNQRQHHFAHNHFLEGKFSSRLR